jgi:hypothetical protein
MAFCDGQDQAIGRWNVLLGAFLEVDGERYGGEEIHRLHNSTDFPLSRRAAPSLR